MKGTFTMKRWLGFMVLSLGIWPGCGSNGHKAAAPPETVRDVALVTAQRSRVPDWLEVAGTVRATQTAQVASQMMGTLTAVTAKEGDVVRAGQVLAEIDDAQPRAGVERAAAAANAARQEVSSAEADYGLANSTLQRYQALYDKKSVSPQEFDEVKARQRAAEARREMTWAGQSQADAVLAQARTAESYARVRAPFDGVVTAKLADAGTLATPGMPLFTVEDTRRFRLETTVDESDMALIKLGAEAPLAIDALRGQSLMGKIVRIVPAADPASHSFTVKIELAAVPGLRSGLFGRARFARGQRDAVVIPREAVVERGQLLGVYVLDTDKIASLRYITLGKADGECLEVLSGLLGGEVLVAQPGDRELGGHRIEGRP